MSETPEEESPALSPELLGRRKLNVGCGWDLREGYLNVDGQSFHHPDLVADIRSLSMLPSGHYQEIVAQDVLEHLPRVDVPIALSEWSRLLAPGGQLVLRIPDLIGLLGLLVEHPTVAVHEELEQCLYGTQAYPGDFHQSGFTELTLRSRLDEAGLALASLEHRDGWLFDAVAVKGSAPPVPVQFLEPAFVTQTRNERNHFASELTVTRNRRVLRWIDHPRVSTWVHRVAIRLPARRD